MIEKSNLNIVFYGTPEFAVESLKQVLDHGYKVAAVVTAPDKPSGRGRKIQESQVKQFAVSKGIHVLQPQNLKSEEFASQLKAIEPNLQIVVAFRMMPESVWSFPKLGTFNLHASLLPAYRGAAPINHAIINGEETTGVTTFFLKHKIDTGDLLLQRQVHIDTNDTGGTLHDKLKLAGGELVVETLRMICSGKIKPIPQPTGNGYPDAPKIFKEFCNISWNQKAEVIRNFVRGLSPYPSAQTCVVDEFNNEHYWKVYSGHVADSKDLQPGQIEIRNGKIHIGTSDFDYVPETIQPRGKKPMNVSDYINGLKSKLIKAL